VKPDKGDEMRADACRIFMAGIGSFIQEEHNRRGLLLAKARYRALKDILITYPGDFLGQ
jgi:hypothetical protein